MFIDIDNIPPYERQLLLIANQAVQNSHEIDTEQKTRIEAKFQDIVDIWTKGKR